MSAENQGDALAPSNPASGLAMITVSGIVVTDPRLHDTADGAIARFDVAAHERHFDPVTHQWVDTGTTLLPCSIGLQGAQHVATSLTIGNRVLITGVLRKRDWEDTTGDKRYAYEVDAIEVAISLNYASARVIRAEQRPE